MRAATIFTGCDMSDQGDHGLLHRITDMAREAGLQICGPNSMGLLNPTIGAAPQRLRLTSASKSR